MEIGKIETAKEIRKCFKYRKTEYIRQNCKQKTLVAIKSENKKTLIKKEDQKKDNE